MLGCSISSGLEHATTPEHKLRLDDPTERLNPRLLRATLCSAKLAPYETLRRLLQHQTCTLRNIARPFAALNLHPMKPCATCCSTKLGHYETSHDLLQHRTCTLPNRAPWEPRNLGSAVPLRQKNRIPKFRGLPLNPPGSRFSFPLVSRFV
jgi:hypothetical protein